MAFLKHVLFKEQAGAHGESLHMVARTEAHICLEVMGLSLSVNSSTKVPTAPVLLAFARWLWTPFKGQPDGLKYQQHHWCQSVGEVDFSDRGRGKAEKVHHSGGTPPK